MPLGLIGGVTAVALAHPVLSVSSLVGFVTVVGFVLRNGILLLQRYREGVADGLSVEQAIREGSMERMVPIILTSLTTVLGMIPLLTDAFYCAMAVTIMAGLAFATVLTMIVIPVNYALVYRITAQPSKVR